MSASEEKKARRTLDSELNAIKDIIWALETLDEDAQQRALRYVCERYPEFTIVELDRRTGQPVSEADANGGE